MSFLISGIFVAFISAITFKLLKDRYKLFKLNITDPNDFPFIVEIFYPIIVLGMGSAEERFKIIAGYCLRFPDMVKMWLGPKLLIFTSNPDRIQKILLSQKCLEKWNFFYGLMERDYGLISGSLKRKWKEHRKFFNFSFNLKILESFLPSFVEHSEMLCNQLVADVEGREFDFFVYAKKVSFDILCATSLGTNMMDYKSNKTFYEKIFEAYETTELAMNDKFAIPFLYPQTIYRLTSMYREERKAQKILDDFQRDILMERRKVIKMKELCNNNDEPNERNILIDQIILNEEKFTADEVRDHVLTFVSGYETWGNALAHAMLLLAIHPEVQKLLFDEIKSTITSDDDLKSSATINNMQYLEIVQKEIFRLLPTVPVILRETLEDFEIEPDLVIPKETNLLINFYALHRRKDVWGDDADEFKPERFLPENSINRHPFAFLPFSSGPRICIGFKYSNLSLKIAIIKLIQQFKFTSSMTLKDIRVKSYISLKLCTKHLMTIEKRSKTN